MTRPTLLLLLVPIFLSFGACLPTNLDPVAVESSSETTAFLEDVKPVLDKRCVVCHSCYNAPCQLKLSSFEGADRGGSKLAVYDSARLTHQEPTRLFTDAAATPEWRKQGFHTVLDSTAAAGFNNSILLQLLEAKRRNPIPDGEYHSEGGQSCSANDFELGIFLARNPDQGMPFGFPPLEDEEHETLASWVAQGADGPTPTQQRALVQPTKGVAAEIAKWERFLNDANPKHAMTARYLFEHYFLAHLHFPGGSEASTAKREFYRLVRSSTPPGEPIQVLATTRPYDPVAVDTFYYRFRKIHSTIVHKTHMIVELDDARLARMGQLFIEPEWLEQPQVEALDDRDGANPFLVFAEIPPASRYRFLLDHSQYIIDTFIRGPVCKGQVALNVIHDHFWLMFLDPAADQSVQNPDFLIAQAENLRLPTEQGSQERVLRTFSNRYRERYEKFFRAKIDLYREHTPEGSALDDIWKGERAGDAPVLTVYRHFDSASVHRGVLGDLPRTAWVIDYPQFERIYYALVAGFDVFGNVSHQVNVRRYMDYLRIEGELNFLQFMPVEARLPMLQSWYIGDRAIENVSVDDVTLVRPIKLSYETDDPKREFIERVVGDHILLETDIRFDPINYTWDGEEIRMPESFRTHAEILNAFRALTAPGTGFISHVSGTAANVLLVRVRDYDGEDRMFSIIINRWHDNVNSMFSEAGTLDPDKDTIDFLSGSIGSYPNYFLDVAADDVPDFFDMLENYDNSPIYEAKLRKYGVPRDDPDFWEIFDWFQARFEAEQPIHSGLYDLNRYYPTTQED